MPPLPSTPPPAGHPIHPELARRVITPDDFELPPSTAGGAPLRACDVERALGGFGVAVPPAHAALFESAFTHMSGAVRGQRESYERLEYIGDAVLAFVVAKFLFDSFPGEDEGFLTRVRTKIVSGKFLATLSWRLGLHALVVMNQEGLSKGFNANPKILEDVFEAVVGAVYLSAGLVAARDFVLGVVRRHVALDDLLVDTNHKDRLTRYLRTTMAAGQTTPPAAVYAAKQTPTKAFQVVLLVDGVVAGRGTARTKKDAEQAAAKDALQRFGVPDELITSTTTA